MTTAPTSGPFAGLEDERAATPDETVTALLGAALRGYVPLRKIFVQRERTTPPTSRAAKLAEIVRGKHHRPLDVLLLLHALEPILRDGPLDVRTWARTLSTNKDRPCSPNAVSKAFSTLIELKLATRAHEGRQAVVRPLHEAGTEQEWTRPGESKEAGPGFFTLPHEYWTAGYVDRLTLPGKAMLLIMLAETQSPTKQYFTMPVSQAHEWYGLSERTAERGYRELNQAGLLDIRVQKITDPRHPAGRREEHHRALMAPFSTVHREHLQQRTRIAARKSQSSASAPQVAAAE